MMRTLRQKAILGACAIITCLTVLGGLLIYRHMSQTLMAQAVHDSEVKLTQARDQLDYFLDDVTKVAQFIITDSVTIRLLKDLEKAQGGYFEQYRNVTHVAAQLVRLTSNREYINSAMIRLNSGEVASFHPVWNPYFAETFAENWFAIFAGGARARGFSPVHRIKNRAEAVRAEGETQDVFSYVCPVFDVDNPSRKLGTLVLHIDKAATDRLLRTIGGEFDSVALHGAGGESYYAGESPGALSGAIALSGALRNADWTLDVRLLPERVLAKTWETLAIMLAILVSMLLLICALISSLIYRLTRPLKQLTGSVLQAIDGDLSARVDIRTKDEMETLARCYNRLMDELQVQMRQLVEQEEAKRGVQIQLLLAQINPHFIYNTLNSIIYMARQDRSQDVVSMTQAFIHILQDIVNIGSDRLLSSVRDELMTVEYYLGLQRYRYPDRFDYACEVDPEALDALVPRTLLEPLVENALYHGICPRMKRGRIRLSVRASGGRLHIEVADDGVGMPLEACEALARPGRKNQAPTSAMFRVGISNIVERLNMLYGETAQFRIESVPEAGTTIWIDLPQGHQADCEVS